jgi:hypothetical protein
MDMAKVLRDYTDEIYNSRFWKELQGYWLRILEVEPGRHLHITKDGVNAQLRIIYLRETSSQMEIQVATTDLDGNYAGCLSIKCNIPYNLISNYDSEDMEKWAASLERTKKSDTQYRI